MKNINLMGRFKKKSNIFLISKTPENSLFFYFLKNWKFYENIILNSVEECVCLQKNKVNFSKYSNEFILNSSINTKINSNLIIKKHRRRRNIPTTSVKLKIEI